MINEKNVQIEKLLKKIEAKRSKLQLKIAEYEILSRENGIEDAPSRVAQRYNFTTGILKINTLISLIPFL